MKSDSTTNLFPVLRMAMLIVVLTLLAVLFPAAESYYNTVSPATEFPALDAIASHNLAILRRATQGPKIETPDKNGLTPLIVAIQMGDAQAIEDLLERGADVNHNTEKFGSPLTVALSTENASVARKLIERHADVNYQTNDGDTPLLAAVRGGDCACIDLILASRAERYAVGSRRNPLTEASASDGTLDVLRHLLSLKFDPNWIARDGAPSIVSAAAYGSDGCVKALLDAGADPALADSHGRTAWSVSEPFPKVRSLLAPAVALE